GIHPLVELSERHDMRPEAHLRVGKTAVLCTLAVESPNLIGRERLHDVDAVRNHVHLAEELGDPEAVDNVLGFQGYRNLAPHGQVQLIGGYQRAPVRADTFVLEFKPPLMANGADMQCLWLWIFGSSGD